MLIADDPKELDAKCAPSGDWSRFHTRMIIALGVAWVLDGLEIQIASIVANGLTAFSFNYGIFLVFRFVAGMGIGGEYAAIHSAIDELIPAKYRGRVDLAVSGTYWFGAIIGSLSEYLLLNHSLLADDVGWRLGFFIGPVIGLGIWGLRRTLPESPRWQLSHGQGRGGREDDRADRA